MGNETAVREKLRSGGELVICGGDVRIEYFFPGPDRRYGGSRLMISGRDIPGYCLQAGSESGFETERYVRAVPADCQGRMKAIRRRRV